MKLVITSIYLILAGLWILFSNMLIRIIFQDYTMYMKAQITNEIVCVLMTAWLIFTIIKHKSEEYQRLKKENEESQTKLISFLNIIENMQESTIITSPSGKIVWANPSFTKVTGYSIEEAMGKNPRFLQSGKHDAEFYNQMWDTVTRQGRWQGEIWNRRKNGEIYPEWLTITAIKDLAGETLHYSAIFQDISKEKQAYKDIQIASQIQKELVPKDFQDERMQIKTLYHASNFVSGDMYDFVRIGDHKWFGFLIDVMGHGLSTSLQGSAIHVLFRQLANDPIPLAQKMQIVNQTSMPYFFEGTFCAAMAFELDLERNELRYCGAGINNLLAFTRTHRGISKAPGLFLGIDIDVTYEEHSITLDKGDHIHFFTDGLFDLLLDRNLLDYDFDSIFDLYHDLIQSVQSFDDATAISIKLL